MDFGILYVVYNEAIRNPKTNERLYKIGITKNTVSERYYGLGLKMLGKFETLFAYKLDNYEKAEQSIHEIMNKYRENGEWFNLTQKEIDVIKLNCEIMGGENVTDEVNNEINVSNTKENITQKNVPQNRNDSMDYLKELVRTIGMATFVKYYSLFANKDYSVSEIIQNMKLNENYKMTSIRTKSSMGKRIFKEHLEKDALEIISQSNIVDIKTKEEAIKLLKNNQ
jgi:rRNA maturation endonuclease Nob1